MGASNLGTMQFTKPFKEAIRAGEVTCSFRAWKSPRARVGGQYNLHPVGAIEVTSVQTLLLKEAKQRAIKASGFADRQALAKFLKVADDDQVFLVEFRYLGDAAVKVPPKNKPDSQERRELLEKLGKMDARSSHGPWTRHMLELIAARPGTRAADLATVLGWETRQLKANVRKLKQLGLTDSLEVGYRLTERGQTVLDAC